MRQVVVIEAHDVHNKFWIIEQIIDFFLSYTRCYKKMVLLLHMFSDVMLYFEEKNPNIYD